MKHLEDLKHVIIILIIFTIKFNKNIHPMRTSFITSKAIRLQPVFILKKYEVSKKLIFLSEKMRNPGNCIQDSVHSFFGKDF